MEFVPPVSVRRIGTGQFGRFLVRDGGGHYWTGSEWSNDPSKAVLYLRESEAMRAGLQVHDTDGATETFKAVVVVTVTKDAWRMEELVAYLKRWARLLLMKNQETRMVRVEIDWDRLVEGDGQSG